MRSPLPTRTRARRSILAFSTEPSCAPTLSCWRRVWPTGGSTHRVCPTSQAAVYAARHARHVTLLVRADSLARRMSDYLIRELGAVLNLTVQFHTEVAA